MFAVHPLHVESVAWIIERKDLLSALFYLTAALTWIRFVEGPGWGRYGLALALFTAGLLSKSVVVTFPAALLIWHWWQRERVTSTDLFRLAPFFVVGLAVTLADLSFYTSREPLSLGYSLIERVLIASRALWFYVGKLLWPTDLAVIYPLWDIRAGDPLAWAYLAAAVAVAVLLWLGRHRVGRGPLAGGLFYAVTLSPVLVWCLTNTLMKLRGHFGCRQGAMTCRGGFQTRPCGVHHARKSNAADGQKDPQIRKRICETPH